MFRSLKLHMLAIVPIVSKFKITLLRKCEVIYTMSTYETVDTS